MLVYFGHGLRHSLPQLGATLGNIASLAAALALASTAPLVVLYACSAANGDTAGGEGGYCDALRDALCNSEAPGCVVLGHDTAGHCCRNPFVRRFTREPGSQWVIAPGAVLWKPWRTALQGPLRLRFPFMAQHEIETQLAPGEVA